MTKWKALIGMSFVGFSVAACATMPAATNPCDLLVAQTPKASTNTYLVNNDRLFASQVARHRGRYAKYECDK